MNIMTKLLTILLLTIPFFNGYAQTKTEAKKVTLANTALPNSVDFEELLQVDSIDHLNDYVLIDSLLVLVGFTFSDAESTFSKVACININSMKVMWTKVFNKYQNVEYQKISVHNNEIFITGTVADKSLIKDDEIYRIWLRLSIVKLNLQGGILQYFESDDTNAGRFTSNLVLHNNYFYMTYWFHSLSETRLMKFTNKLEPLSERRINKLLYYNHLLVFDDNIHLLATDFSFQMILMKINSDNSEIFKIPFEPSFRTSESSFCLKNNNFTIDVIGYKGKNIAKILAKYSLQGDKLLVDEIYEMTDTLTYFYTIPNLQRNQSQVYLQTRNSFESVNILNDKIDRIKDFKSFHPRIHSYYELNNNETIFLTDNGINVSIMKLNASNN